MDRNWSFSDTALGFALYYLAFSLADVLGARSGLGKPSVFALSAIAGSVVLMLLLYRYVYRATIGGGKLKIFSTELPKDTLLGISIGILLGFLGFLNQSGKGGGLFQAFSVDYLRLNFIPSSVMGIAVFLVVFVLVLPIVEGMYFRSFMFPALGKHLNVILAAIATSCFSSIFLSGTVSFFYLLLSGFVFCILYERSETAYSGIVAHGTMNLILALTILLKGGSS